MILICDDDAAIHVALKRALKGKRECRSAYNGDEAIAVLRNQPIELVLLDVQMRSANEGLELIPKLRQADPDVMIVMTSSRTDLKTVREAMRLGAVDFVGKDSEPEELLLTIERVLDRRNLIQRREQQNFETLAEHRGHVLIGESPAIQQLRRSLEKVRQSQANVVIFGETGTGKEVVARQLRKGLKDGTLEPFVALDSSTIQSSTAESQLFGHEKGAFTGADKATKGVFEEANGGVVYFDEIANMPLTIQAKLLRVLQEKEVVRLGASKVLKLEFRVICATNRDLEELSSKGEFKDDLMQRLNVLPIALPPLRDRSEDVPLLIRHFAQKHAFGGAPLAFTDEALGVLKEYTWPGNIRELSNLVAYLVTMTDSAEVDVADLPPKFRDSARKRPTGAASAHASQEQAPESEDGSFYDRVGRYEREILIRAYEKLSGNISKLALGLGMDRSHLYTKLKEHGIHSPKK